MAWMPNIKPVMWMNDLNGIMITRGRSEIIIFDIHTPHDELLKNAGKTRAESVIFAYSPPLAESTSQGSIIIVTTHLEVDKVQTCLDFVVGSWP